ncbi:hypothetical protein Csp2054_12170 [Curtobacterium sp. 'Ferrero']|uniref:recombinase family protein n=1 Tax=Curtobacterium sp. 'Ferrero' TaxID=2033654 RepID=UPI000BC6137C|nr:recombinase family protein [Curtobacterium sp. 'Ferrero']PCN47415.1 hypothetical protein Csp2054_12170 [Curtobacterium sp. 'Ferrero']
MKVKRSVLYTRVSRSTEESVSVDRQERELRQVAEREGWPVVAVFQDDGLSGRTERAKADAALAMLAEGRAEVLMVWEMSRWSRMGLGAVAKLVDVLDEKPDALFLAQKEGLRSDQPAFRLMASVISEVARMEAEGTRDRIKAMRSYVLSETDPSQTRWLGGSVPFGYRPVMREGGGKALQLDPDEAAVAREAAEKFVAGMSLTDVTRLLQERHVATPQSPARRARQAGKPVDGLDAGTWRITTVRKLLLSPTLIGRTTQGDGVVTDATGLPITRWEPVIDVGTWNAIQTKAKARAPYQDRKASSWLSGFLFCGLCGSVLYVNSRKDRVNGSFRCANKAIPGQACPGVSISREGVEAHMEGVILGMIGGLDEYRVTERIEGADAGELDAVAQAIADVQSALAGDDADYGALLPKLDELKARRRALQEAPGRVVKTRESTGRKLADAWAEGSVRERQYIISDMIRGIEVQPATRPRQPVEERLVIVWNDPAAEDDD